MVENMKRIFITILAILLMISLTGCLKMSSREMLLNKTESENEKVTKDVEEKIVEAINNADEDMLFGIFSEETKEKNADIRNQIHDLIALFDGKKIVSEDTHPQHSQGGANYDEWIVTRSGCITLETGEQYDVMFSMVAKQETNPIEEGVYNLCVFEGDKDDSPDEFTWGGDYGIELYVFDESVVTNMVQSIVDAINNTDAEAIKALLSENAKEYIFDVDTDIQWLFDAFYGKKIVDFTELKLVLDSTYTHRHDAEVSNRWSRIYVLTLEDGTEYEMKISMYSMDKEDPGNVGLNVLKVLTTTQEQRPDASDVHWDSWVGDPAIESITI